MLSTLLPKEVFDHKDRYIQHIPERQVLDNLPVIWAMLGPVIQYWSIASRNIPSFINVKDKYKRSVFYIAKYYFDSPYGKLDNLDQ
jgi:hypothetical protein